MLVVGTLLCAWHPVANCGTGDFFGVCRKERVVSNNGDKGREKKQSKRRMKFTTGIDKNGNRRTRSQH